ncbi:hypothetical protein HK101_006865 [Irineochytrium annulatum]|nr:hypothetical protein HK101_006865 [Irineochytrium annulatum]
MHRPSMHGVREERESEVSQSEGSGGNMMMEKVEGFERGTEGGSDGKEWKDDREWLVSKEESGIANVRIL